MANRIGVINKEGNVETTIPANGSSGLAAGFGVLQGIYTYEFRIPLQKGDISHYGIGTQPGKTISLGLEWGGMGREGRQRMKVQPRTTARKAGQYIQHIMKVGLLMACLTIGLSTTAFTNPEEPKGQTLKPLSNDSLTLNQCIAIALRNSHRVAIAKGEISKAKINLKDARAGFLPEVYLSGGYTLNNIYDELEWNEKHYNLTLSASMSPFAGGRKLINVSNSQASLSVAQEGYRLTQASLVLDVTRKYYNLLKAEGIWRVKLHSLSQKRTHLDFAQTKYGLGLSLIHI